MSESPPLILIEFRLTHEQRLTAFAMCGRESSHIYARVSADTPYLKAIGLAIAACHPQSYKFNNIKLPNQTLRWEDFPEAVPAYWSYKGMPNTVGMRHILGWWNTVPTREIRDAALEAVSGDWLGLVRLWNKAEAFRSSIEPVDY